MKRFLSIILLCSCGCFVEFPGRDIIHHTKNGDVVYKNIQGVRDYGHNKLVFKDSDGRHIIINGDFTIK